MIQRNALKRRLLGQHFLKDTAVCESITDEVVRQVQAHGCHHLLEIGPGKGALTLLLLEKLKNCPHLLAFDLCEKDPELARRYSDLGLKKLPYSVVVHESDFLQFDATYSGSRNAVVSNLPYSTGTAILNRLNENLKSISVMILMFQAEVARRLRATASQDRGSLSLWIQNGWDVQLLMEVSPSCFSPPPEVDSEVVVLTRRDSPQIPGTFPGESGCELWQQLLQLSFSHRRQMLRRVLRSSELWKKALEDSGVDGTKRAESLDWSEWNAIFKAGKK